MTSQRLRRRGKKHTPNKSFMDGYLEGLHRAHCRNAFCGHAWHTCPNVQAHYQAVEAAVQKVKSRPSNPKNKYPVTKHEPECFYKDFTYPIHRCHCEIAKKAYERGAAQGWDEGYLSRCYQTATYQYGVHRTAMVNPYNGREPNSDRVDKNYLGWEKL